MLYEMSQLRNFRYLSFLTMFFRKIEYVSYHVTSVKLYQRITHEL